MIQCFRAFSYWNIRWLFEFRFVCSLVTPIPVVLLCLKKPFCAPGKGPNNKMALWLKITRNPIPINISCWYLVLVYLSVFAPSSTSQSVNSCPTKCSCLGTLVDCSKQGLTKVPKDLPLWTEVLWVFFFLIQQNIVFLICEVYVFNSSNCFL